MINIFLTHTIWISDFITKSKINDFALWDHQIQTKRDVSDFPLVSGVFLLLPVKLICAAMRYNSYRTYAYSPNGLLSLHHNKPML